MKPLSAKKEERRALTNDETTGILRAIQGHKQGAFLAVFITWGFGEALGLQWGEFDWDEDAVHIQRDIIYVRGKTTPHYFRHNYITKLFYAGVDPVLAMWMVEHADYETTVNVYTHLKSQRLRKKMADMDWMYDLKKAASKLYQPDEMVGR